MLTTLRPLSVILAALLAAACSSASPPGGSNAPDSGYPEAPVATAVSAGGTLSISIWTAPDQPPTTGASSVRLRVTDTGSKLPVDGLTLSVVPWMPAMGHGSSVEPTVTPEGDGVYVLTNVNFFMAGRWELRIAITGGVTDHVEASLDVS